MNDEPILEELLSRCTEGVFALRTPDGMIHVHTGHKKTWILAVGLSSRLQAETAQHTLYRINRMEVSQMIASYGPLGEADLATASTDELLAELYRILPGDWVLGLLRSKKQAGYWTGLCWNGSPLVCCGLATAIGQTILNDVLYDRLIKKQQPIEDEVENLTLQTLEHNRTINLPNRTWMLGMLGMVEHILRHLGTEQAIPGDDLRKFVAIDVAIDQEAA